MQPPKISNRFRRKAGEKAVAARRERATIKALVASGELFFFEGSLCYHYHLKK